MYKTRLIRTNYKKRSKELQQNSIKRSDRKLSKIAELDSPNDSAKSAKTFTVKRDGRNVGKVAKGSLKAVPSVLNQPVCCKCKHAMTVHQVYSSPSTLFKPRTKRIQSRLKLSTPKTVISETDRSALLKSKISPFVLRFFEKNPVDQIGSKTAKQAESDLKGSFMKYKANWVTSQHRNTKSNEQMFVEQVPKTRRNRTKTQMKTVKRTYKRQIDNEYGNGEMLIIKTVQRYNTRYRKPIDTNEEVNTPSGSRMTTTPATGRTRIPHKTKQTFCLT